MLFKACTSEYGTLNTYWTLSKYLKEKEEKSTIVNICFVDLGKGKKILANWYTVKSAQTITFK